MGGEPGENPEFRVQEAILRGGRASSWSILLRPSGGLTRRPTCRNITRDRRMRVAKSRRVWENEGGWIGAPGLYRLTSLIQPEGSATADAAGAPFRRAYDPGSDEHTRQPTSKSFSRKRLYRQDGQSVAADLLHVAVEAPTTTCSSNAAAASHVAFRERSFAFRRRLDGIRSPNRLNHELGLRTTLCHFTIPRDREGIEGRSVGPMTIGRGASKPSRFHGFEEGASTA
jgi:hypothetical protein